MILGLCVWQGASKADAVKGCLEPAEGQDRLPTGRARPTAGELLWFMDDPAASKLQKDFITF
jgi:6-phosphogluconolactonase